MSDIFETDIDSENENLASLEDKDVETTETSSIVVDYPLYHLKLDYSSETIYAKTPDSKMKISAGDFVIVPTRYGKDMARVLGTAKKPIGIKQSDIATIDRKANEADLKRRDELLQKEKGEGTYPSCLDRSGDIRGYACVSFDDPSYGHRCKRMGNLYQHKPCAVVSQHEFSSDEVGHGEHRSV